MFKYRECKVADCDNWIDLNREFMASEIQDNDLWNGADTVNNEQFIETFKSGLNTPERVRFLLFEEDSIPVGFTNLMVIYSVWTHGLACIVDDLYLRECVRGKGYGRQAMAYIEEYAKSIGCKRIQFQSEITNPGAESFYRAIGYNPADMKFSVKYFD